MYVLPMQNDDDLIERSGVVPLNSMMMTRAVTVYEVLHLIVNHNADYIVHHYHHHLIVLYLMDISHPDCEHYHHHIPNHTSPLVPSPQWYSRTPPFLYCNHLLMLITTQMMKTLTQMMMKMKTRSNQ